MDCEVSCCIQYGVWCMYVVWCNVCMYDVSTYIYIYIYMYKCNLTFYVLTFLRSQLDR